MPSSPPALILSLSITVIIASFGSVSKVSVTGSSLKIEIVYLPATVFSFPTSISATTFASFPVKASVYSPFSAVFPFTLISELAAVLAVALNTTLSNVLGTTIVYSFFLALKTGSNVTFVPSAFLTFKPERVVSRII